MLVTLRKRALLNQTELSDRILDRTGMRITQNMLSNIERGTRQCSQEEAAAIAAALGVPTSEIFEVVPEKYVVKVCSK